MFKIRFKVVELRNGGVTITHYLHGKRNEVKKDIEMFKNRSSKYEMMGKDGMIVWA